MSESGSRSKIGTKLDKYFHKIFNPSHIAYTIFFFIEALTLILFFFLGSTNLGDVGLYLATTFSLSFIILMVLGVSSKFDKYLFTKSLDQHKTLIFLGSLGLSAFIILLYFLFGNSTQIPIQFLGWDYILPGFFIVLYFGWNMAQIFFLKTSFVNISENLDSKVLSSRGSNRNKIFSMVFLILAVLVPVLTQLGTYFSFISFFVSSLLLSFCLYRYVRYYSCDFLSTDFSLHKKYEKRYVQCLFLDFLYLSLDYYLVSIL